MFQPGSFSTPKWRMTAEIVTAQKPAYATPRMVTGGARITECNGEVFTDTRSNGLLLGHLEISRGWGDTYMKTLLNAALLLTLASATARAPINAGELKPEPSLPFTMTQVATFKLPWRIAFLPDGRMLITEKVGPVWLVTQQGEKMPVENAPAVLYQGQGGMLGVFVSPHHATDHSVYLTYAEPGDPGTSGLALARARLAIGGSTASLEGLQVLWRDMPNGRGGQFGAQIAFSPDSQYLFLTVGDRQRMTPAQDPNTAVGKILRLTLDGKPAPGNPRAGKKGALSVPLINPPRDTEAAKTAPVVSTYTFPGPNLALAETW